MQRKKVVLGLILVFILTATTIEVSQKVEELNQQKQWSGQMVLFATKAVELLEPVLEVDNYDDFFAYFERKEVKEQIDELQRLFYMKKEFAENTRAVYVRYGPDSMGQRELVEWKSYTTFRGEQGELSDEDKEQLLFTKQGSIVMDHHYFSQMIEDMMSGKSSLRVPSQKDIELAQKRLDEEEI